MISAVNPFVVPLIFALGLSVAAFLSRLHRKKAETTVDGRFVTIDGLRGYLAFAVFLHHSSVWYFYIQTGRWEVPPSTLYTMLGQGGVALFFMVTSFLFVTKLLDKRGKKTDWFEFFVMRVARLVPVYLVAIIVLFLLVAIRSDWQLLVGGEELAITLYKWLMFTVPGKPDINAVARTSIMLASVTWSLPYEWFFYFCLPLISIILCARVSIGGVVFSVIAISTMLEFWSPLGFILECFVGGVVAALVVRNQRLKSLLIGPCFSVVVVVLLVAVMLLPTAFEPSALCLLSLIFIIGAAGNNVFGILNNTAARWLGELSYGVYMLHGLVLFTLFYFFLGFDFVRGLEPLWYWVVVAGVTPVVLFVAHAVHVGLERPVMLFMRGLFRKFKIKPTVAMSKIS